MSPSPRGRQIGGNRLDANDVAKRDQMVVAGEIAVRAIDTEDVRGQAANECRAWVGDVHDASAGQVKAQWIKGFPTSLLVASCGCCEIVSIRCRHDSLPSTTQLAPAALSTVLCTASSTVALIARRAHRRRF